MEQGSLSSSWATSHAFIGFRRGTTATLLLCMFIVNFPFPCRAFKGERQAATVAWEFMREDCKRGVIPAIYDTSTFGDITLNASLYCPETTHGVGNKMRYPNIGARGKTGPMGAKSAADFYAEKPFWSGTWSFDTWLRLTEATPFGTKEVTALVFVDYGANRNENPFNAAKVYAKGSKIYARDYAETDYPFYATKTPWQGKPVWVHVGIACGFSGDRGWVTTDDDPVGTCLYYYNGETDLTVNVRSSSRCWYERTELSLFAPEVDYPTTVKTPAAWVGEIHYLAVYNRSLSVADMVNQYEAGLPDSEPYALNSSISVMENGEVLGRNYDYPAFYLSPVPVLELVNLTISAGDVDRELGHPNYDETGPDTEVFIASLPSKGTLYHMNGTAITHVPTRLSTAVDCSTGDGFCHVRYRPVWKEVSHPSVYTSFTYYAVDGLLGNRSTTGRLDITVKPGHLPPTANSTSAVTKAGKYVTFELSGRVGGSNSSVSLTSASVGSLPKEGQLFQVFANGSVATHARITSAGTLLWTWRVAYQYTGLHNRTATSEGYVAQDAFTYAVRDSRGYRSPFANVTVDMTPALTAMPQPSLASTSTATQGVRSPIRLFAQDESDLRRPLCAEVRRLPSHGQLYATLASTTPLSEGAILSASPLVYPYTAGVALYYESSGLFFTSPNTTFAKQPRPLLGSEGFDFRFVHCSSPGSASDTVTQPLSVVNVNDPSSVTWPSDKAPFRLTSKSAFTGTWSLQHLAIVDVDEDVDPIKMHVSTNDQRCALTFDAGPLWAVSTLSRGSKEIVVRGMPSALTTLLNTATVSCIRRASDLTLLNLTITLFDGLGAPCLPQSVFTTYSNRSAGCLVTNAALALSAPADAAALGMQLWFIIAVSVGASVGFLCLICALAWYMRRYRARLEMAGYASQNTPTSAAAARAAALNGGVTSEAVPGLSGSSRTPAKPTRAFFPTVQEGAAAEEGSTKVVDPSGVHVSLV